MSIPSSYETKSMSGSSTNLPSKAAQKSSQPVVPTAGSQLRPCQLPRGLYIEDGGENQCSYVYETTQWTDLQDGSEVFIVLQAGETKECLDRLASDGIAEERVDNLDRELDVARALNVCGAADYVHVLPVFQASVGDA